MPVQRCPTCKRGLAGYLDSEKECSDLKLDEVRTEIAKYEAKEARIRQYMADLQAGTVTPGIYPDGKMCPDCGHGWREFQQHQKDLEQLTPQQAQAALAANSHWLVELRNQEATLTATPPGGAPAPTP
jgi:DNA repair exonuclease SbcCD ATPase subunit